MSRLLELPDELLNHIFTFLGTAAPSERDFDSLPTFTRSNTDEKTLKNISSVSHRVRKIVIERLFTHVHVKPASVKELLHFIGQNGLSRKVDSIFIEVLSDESVSAAEQTWWCQLLDQTSATRIMLKCVPEAYDALFGVEVKLVDSWAFMISCQYIELCRQNPTDKAIYCDPSTGLFAATKWQSLRMNEGSSLAAYTSYEYFLKTKPSLISSLQAYLNIAPPVSAELTAYRHAFAEAATKIMATARMLEDLELFSYTAVFPFYNHVDEVLKCIKRMKNLRRLFVKLCPEPDSPVLEDAMEAALGHIDVNDPWSEINIGYTLIAHALLRMSTEGPIESFSSGDVRVEGFLDNIASNLSEVLVEDWTFDGNDTWTKSIVDASSEAVQLAT